MKELLTYVAQNLVEHPDQVVVTESQGEGETVLELRVAPEDMGKVQDTIVLRLKNNGYLSKTDLLILDMICNYEWERPIYFLQQGGDVNIGIKEYLQYDGYAYR